MLYITSRKSFTIIEIMVVVALIALVISIAVPAYFTMIAKSQKTICINNLKKIIAAVDQWALDYNAAPGTVPSEEQEDTIYSYMKTGRPECPAGGEYTIHAIGSEPQVSCSRESEGHTL